MVQKKKNHTQPIRWLILLLIICSIQTSALLGQEMSLGAARAAGQNGQAAGLLVSWLNPFEILDNLKDLAETGTFSTNGVMFNLGCNDNVNTPANANCGAQITPDMILEGTYPPGLSDDDFIVRVVGDDPNENGETQDDIANDVGQFIVEVKPKNPNNFPIPGWDGCWGYITVEDKKNPFVVGPFDEELFKVKRKIPTQAVEGTIGLRSRQGFIDISKYSCLVEDESYSSCDRPYRTVTFAVNRDDMYTLDLVFEGEGEGLLALFREEFNPDNPCEKIFSQTNGRREFQGAPPLPAGDRGPIRLVVPLRRNQVYVALISYEGCTGELETDSEFSLTIYSENGGRAARGFPIQRDMEVCRDLLCSDVEYVRNQTSTARILFGERGIGNPVFEDCTLDRVWFEDSRLVEGGDCGEIYFTRSWYAVDAGGRRLGPITQKVTFRRPTLADIYRPAKTVPIECAGPWSDCLNGEDYPYPVVTGYPFIVSAFGIHDINETYCNLGASYEDISEIVICENTKKIVRQWTLLNWCDVGDQNDLNNGTLVNYRQIIKIGDFTPPVINEMDDIVISTGLFGCDGVLVIPAPDIAGGCQGCDITATVYKLIERPIYDNHGLPTNQTETVEEEIHYGEVGDVVPDLDQAYRYKIYYEVKDQCGNRAEPKELYFTVEDDVAPIAICESNLHISMGNKGIAYIKATDIDEGSNDNCGNVSVYISRKLLNDAVRNMYLEERYGLTINDVFSVVIDGPEGPLQVLKKRSNNEILMYRKGNMWYTWWGPSVAFICADKGANVTIELLAVDGDGTLESYLAGEVNGGTCWLDVLIEDKVAPTCVAPANVEMDCTELPFDFDPEDDAQLAELFGNATATDNCGQTTAQQISKTLDWNCNSGVITRRFRAQGSQGQTSFNPCVQTITIDAVHDYEIKFPKDASFECEAPDADTIEVTEHACDILMVNVHDEQFFNAAGDGACYKIERTYRVINWCEYDGESPPVIVTRNADCDSETGEEDVYVIVRPNGVSYIDRDNDENANPSRSPCGNGARGHYDNSQVNSALKSNGHWQYKQIIKVYDDTAPEVRMRGQDEFCSINNDCMGNIELQLGIADFCAFERIQFEVFFLPDPDLPLASRINLQTPFFNDMFDFSINGTYPNYTITGRFPIGEHRFEIRVEDGCGNQTLHFADFSVIDCKAPQPICINGLALGLMPTEPNTDADGDGDIDLGAVDIWASDFKVSGLEDCSGPVKLSINRRGETPDPDQGSLILTCDDLDTLTVEIWAWDSAYNPNSVQPDGTMGGPNYGRCITYILLQDNTFNLCNPPNPGTVGISGLITTEEDEMVEKTEVRLSGRMSTTQMTGLNGSFSFRNLPVGQDYSITPFKNDSYLNGVSTYDLVLMTKHILGTKELDSPYKLIAADVNNSGSISALDLIQLRKLILGVRTDLPNNSSWRFVPASYTFPNPRNPWRESFPELINYNDLGRNMTTGDFIAVKVGDVSNNAVANSQSGRVRSLAGTFYLQAEEQELKAGNEYRVTISAAELAKIQGCQFTLEFDTKTLELLDMEYGIAQADNFGMTYVEDGVVTMSWNTEAPVTQSRDFCTMIFQTKTDGYLSHLLSLGSRVTPAEAYDQADDILEVALQFIDGQTLPTTFELYQNRPNPFGENTVIEFFLPEDGQATLTLHNINGEVLKVFNGVYQAGLNQITLNRKDLFQSGISAGVLYYTLRTGNQMATKKMVMME